jgi:hypothetical protein
MQVMFLETLVFLREHGNNVMELYHTDKIQDLHDLEKNVHSLRDI